MDKKRTPNQAWKDAMAAWQMPDAEAKRMQRAEQIRWWLYSGKDKKKLEAER